MYENAQMMASQIERKQILRPNTPSDDAAREWAITKNDLDEARVALEHAEARLLASTASEREAWNRMEVVAGRAAPTVNAVPRERA